MEVLVLGIVTLAMFGFCVWQSIYYHGMIKDLTLKLMSKSCGEYAMLTKPSTVIVKKEDPKFHDETLGSRV